ncbi:MAG: hypothetical protein HRU77_01710 [Gammaproteobacteria bacterium]|nr:MAG: hypothetical protein HRU77_01710 [Gammaproteobacteria bacterium]
MNKLHVLPNGNGINISLVTGVIYEPSSDLVLGCRSKAAVRIEYGDSVTYVIFDADAEAIKFRDELIALVNSQREQEK